MHETKTKLLALAGAMLLAWPAAAAAKGLRMQPGRWETTSVTTMPMMPQPQTVTETQCISKEDIEEPFKKFLSMDGCKVLRQKRRGDTIEYALECVSGHGTMTGQGSFTGKGKTAHGTMTLQVTFSGMEGMGQVPGMPAPGQPMQMKMQWRGRYLGPCE